MANLQRGEVRIKLGESDFTLRASFDALAQIEERVGENILPLFRRFCTGNMGMREFRIIIEECLKAAGNQIPENIGEMILSSGLTTLIKPVQSLIGYAITGDRDPDMPQGEAAAGASTNSPGDVTAN